MLVRKTHHRIVLGSIKFPTDNLQLNIICFHTVAKKDFANLLDACWRPEVFIALPKLWPQKRHLYLLEYLPAYAKQQVQILWKREKYFASTSIRKYDRITMAYSLIGYAIPAPTAKSKNLSTSWMTFQSHCIMVVIKSHWKWTWNTTGQHTVNHNQVTFLV
jgi:hypothetical protein